MLSTEDLVDLHDKVLRGDGEGKLGVVALVASLCLKVDVLEKTVHGLELTVAKSKGWVAGAIFVGAGAGSVITFILEHFVVGKH